jgi:regulator of replication initiation timing
MADDPDDPIVAMLMQQVSSLMRERAALVEANSTLQRDNEALQELVGLLANEDSRHEGGEEGSDAG